MTELLENLKPRDIVKFRAGGSWEIEFVHSRGLNHNNRKILLVQFRDSTSEYFYDLEGNHHTSANVSPFDIIEVKAAEEPWIIQPFSGRVYIEGGKGILGVTIDNLWDFMITIEEVYVKHMIPSKEVVRDIRFRRRP